MLAELCAMFGSPIDFENVKEWRVDVGEAPTTPPNLVRNTTSTSREKHFTLSVAHVQTQASNSGGK